MLKHICSFILLIAVFSDAYAVEAPGRGAVSDTAPGRAKPHKVAATQSFYIAWGDKEEERSFIVIEPGDGMRRPAIVATLEEATGKLRVVYTGTAYKDQAGNVHIDCREARIHGPERRSWSPDSFLVRATGKLEWMDDARRAGHGKVLSWAAHAPEDGPLALQALPDLHSYRYMRLTARWHLEGVL